ncbi:hypothetical protein GCM10009648_41930 [Tsukamurella spumae]
MIACSSASPVPTTVAASPTAVESSAPCSAARPVPVAASSPLPVAAVAAGPCHTEESCPRACIPVDTPCSSAFDAPDSAADGSSPLKLPEPKVDSRSVMGLTRPATSNPGNSGASGTPFGAGGSSCCGGFSGAVGTGGRPSAARTSFTGRSSSARIAGSSPPSGVAGSDMAYNTAEVSPATFATSVAP